MIYKKQVHIITRFLESLTAWTLRKSFPLYQPIVHRGNTLTGGSRECLDRWQLIEKEIIADQPRSLLDLGCAEGFYVLMAAKNHQCVSLGVDADIRRFMVAYHQLFSERIMPAGFMLAEIDIPMLKKLPQFDFVILLSVLHHVMYERGEQYALEFLQAVRPKVGKALIFEMGQSNEIKNKWASRLPDMGPNPHEWIKDFLLRSGFSKVTKIGESAGYQKEQDRAIFKVEP